MLHYTITPAEPGQGFSCQYATSHYYTGRTRAGIQLSVGYITLLHRQNPGRDSAVSGLHHPITPAEPGQGSSCQYATSYYYTSRTRAGIKLSVCYITLLHRHNPGGDLAVSMLHHTITPAEPGQGFSCQ